MANRKQNSAEPEPEDGLLPADREITLADPDTGKPVTLTVREFRFLDGLQAQAIAGALIGDLAALAGESGRGMTPAALGEILGRHSNAWLDLSALATGRDVDWIARLREPGASLLSQAVWAANDVFFIGRILGEVGGRLPMTDRWASLTSLISSRAQATDAPNG